ncbi:hypothetical protein HT031_002255 [Scenedesmus sp. PABB004]|nr:hypothetical protein HT031_002255 [Scenedesmus sp. PABB004]
MARAAPGPAAPHDPRLLHLTGYQHPWRLVRLFWMTVMFKLMVLRSLPLFWRELLLLAGASAAACAALGARPLLLAAGAWCALLVWCWRQAAARVEYIRGHRAGAHGYDDGGHCENTVEGMLALIAEDNGPSGPVVDLHYVEVDIQETADGELVVLHDFALGRAFPPAGPNLAVYDQLRAEGLRQPGTAAHVAVSPVCSCRRRAVAAAAAAAPAGPPAAAAHARPPARARAQDLTLAQLKRLHIAGRPGLHAPTLAELMAAFRRAGCRRPLVVEVKRVASDAAKERLLDLMREHKPYADAAAAAHPGFTNPQLGHLALIAFPHFYARCFGEFGGAAWRRWARAYTAAGVPRRSCARTAPPPAALLQASTVMAGDDSFSWTWRRAAKTCLAVALLPALTCGVSGDWAWRDAWAAIGLQLAVMVPTAVGIWRDNPSLYRERERFLSNAGTAAFDRWLAPAVVALTPLAWAAAGLQRRWGRAGAPLPPAALAAALALDAAGLGLEAWAMLANTWFSSVVRVQPERGHRVCDAGPYAAVRHPGYAGFVVQSLGEAVLLRSTWAFAVVLLRAAVLAARTLAEEGVLRAGLPGYAAYQRRVRARWLPGVW